MLIKSTHDHTSLKYLFNDDHKFQFQKNKLHEICSYVAMYPPKLVNKLIKIFTKKGDLIYDPFSGRGTTLLEARIAERQAYASDLNPLSFVITKAKSRNLDKSKILARIERLENKYSHYKFQLNRKDYGYMKTYFSKNVYHQLCFIKNELGRKWRKLNDIDTFILSCFLGILHGPTRKDGTSLFLSISMSNTNAMSKNYVDNYVKKHHLHFPINENIFEKLKEKIEKVFCEKKLPIGNVKMADAKKCHKIFNKKFDCIMTSPPYLNIFNYTRENWIRLWLLDYKKDNLNKAIKLDDNHNYEQYKSFLVEFLNSAYKTLKVNGKLIMIIGDVENKYKFLNLWQEIKNDVKFKLEEHYIDPRANNKSTRKNGSKAGKATKVDNICIFWKYE